LRFVLVAASANTAVAVIVVIVAAVVIAIDFKTFAAGWPSKNFRKLFSCKNPFILDGVVDHIFPARKKYAGWRWRGGHARRQSRLDTCPALKERCGSHRSWAGRLLERGKG
jgi:hypothetical protein